MLTASVLLVAGDLAPCNVFSISAESIPVSVRILDCEVLSNAKPPTIYPSAEVDPCLAFLPEKNGVVERHPAKTEIRPILEEMRAEQSDGYLPLMANARVPQDDGLPSYIHPYSTVLIRMLQFQIVRRLLDLRLSWMR